MAYNTRIGIKVTSNINDAIMATAVNSGNWSLN